MIKILFLTTFFLSATFFSQTTSCNDLVQYAKSADSYPDRVNPFNSTMIAKAEYYTVDNGGLVIAYLKSNDFDYSGKPYIFCGISAQRWAKFKSEGSYGSWGEAFHQYIMDYKCNCN